jgi:pyruvate ferredoxin oxidoreductase gamma subunit
MLRVRLHGRGGQGIKTASQILGTAAFLSGFQAQDFPLYGAERRGAPIVAFTRIDENPILERGPISIPDLLLIGDESLLADTQAAPICGADDQTVVFINSETDPQELQAQNQLMGLPVVYSLSRLCLQYLGDGQLLSTALAAAGARLTGLVMLDDLLQAVETELEPIGVTEDGLKKNAALATDIFSVLSPAVFSQREQRELSPSNLVTVQQKPLLEAAPLITATGNMAMRKTGNWRIHRPEIDYEECNHCLICYARCPEGVIEADAEGKPIIGYDHCKGCMICAQECPKHAIKTIWEMDYGSEQ